MRTFRFLYGPGFLLLAGCAGSSPETPGARGVQTLMGLSEAVVSVENRVKSGLFYVEVQTYRGQTFQATGLILGTDGTALVPFNLKDGKDIKAIHAFVGGKEAEAKLVRSDDHLGMSLLEINAQAGSFTPLSRTAGGMPKPGDWLVVMTATGKELGFQVLSHLSMVRGIWVSDTQQLLMDGNGGSGVNLGTLMTDLTGAPVGIVSQGKVQAFSEVMRRVETVLMAPSAPVTVAGTSKPVPVPTTVRDAYVGIGFQAINEDYAELEGLPREGIWAQYVLKDSPAERAGIRVGDLIVKVDGKPLTKTGPAAVQNLVRLMEPAVGREVRFEVLRNKQPTVCACRFEARVEPKEFLAEDLGLQVREVTDAAYHAIPNLFCQEGVLVTGVINNSPAQPSPSVSRVAQGQVITELDGHPTPDLPSFISAVEGIRKRKPALVLVRFQSGVACGLAALNMRLENTVQTGKGDSK